MNFNFIATDHFDFNKLNNVEDFVDNFPDFQTVFLTDESELNLLLEIMTISDCKSRELNSQDFSKYWDLSNFKFPEFNTEQFDIFYEKWIQKSKRENNMDEYGNLIFLQGLSTKWNRLKFRLIVQEITLRHLTTSLYKNG